MSDIVTRSSSQFDRIQYNEYKSGYYPTLKSACEDLSSLFLFEGKQRVLEPSAGEGEAVLACCKKDDHEDMEIFAVELNEDRAAACKRTGEFEHVLCADFLAETYITNSSFSFIFCNPPYGTESGLESGLSTSLKDRLEKKFFDKCKKYLCKDGILCYVVPYYVFLEDGFCAGFLHSFEILGVYRFPEPEFSRFKQVAVIARKRTLAKAVLAEERKAFQESHQIEKLSWLTKEEEKIRVPEAPEMKKMEFRKIQFDVEEAVRYEKEHEEEDGMLAKTVLAKVRSGQKSYHGKRQFFPPRTISPQNLALLTACGIGSGYAGCLEEKNLHLQRGSVDKKAEYSVMQDASTGKETLVEKISSSTKILLIESDGTITDLCKDKTGEAV